MVGAVVVLIIALITGVDDSCESRTLPNNHLLAKRKRYPNGICLLTSLNISALRPSKLPGNSSFSSLTRASARIVTAVFFGGVEECPPLAFAIIIRLALPFSATLIGAINLSIPGKKPLLTNEPSPRDHKS